MGIPLLRFLFRKMWNTRWLTVSSLVGLIVAVSFTVSIPMYSDGALKRVVTKTLQENGGGLPAGSLLMRYQGASGAKLDPNALQEVDRYIREDVKEQIGFPVQEFVNLRILRTTEVYPVDPTKVDASRVRSMTLGSLSDLDDKVEWTNGKLYGDGESGGVIEAVMLEEAMYRNDLHVGAELEYPISGPNPTTLRIKIVGTFKPKDETSPYWFQGLEGLMSSLIVSPETFDKTIMGEHKVALQQSSWYYAFDLREVQTSHLAPLDRTLNRLGIELYQKLPGTQVEISFAKVLDEFRSQSIQLQMMLFTLAAPMIAMVFYYIAMNANQALEKQQSDIAVLRSRGASTRQIIWLYLLEGLILGAAALAIAPLIGWFMAKSIGSANGFLEFVNRKSIPVGFTSDAVIFGTVAVLIALMASVIPAVLFARQSIVNLKQKLARKDKSPVWQKWFLDVLLLAAAGYGYYMLNQQQLLSFKTGMTSDQLQVQPFLFFIPALAIFACGLFFLRLFPLLLRLFQWLGGKLLPVPLYLTLTQLSRSAKSYYPLMILLILTLGLGVYNASAARTIDTNSTERTLYQYGADAIIETVWESTLVVDRKDQGGNKGGNNGGNNGGGGAGGPGSPGGPGGQQPPKGKQILNEPPFEVFRKLPGVEAAARVMQAKGNVVVSGRSIGQGMVVGIDNDEFAKVAWFRNDLFPQHPFKYLDALGKYYEGAAVIIPTNIAKTYELKPGDVISISLQDQMVEFVVAAILPYWPSQYPDQTPFFITNLEYIYDQVPLMKYDVWLKMKEKAPLAPALKELQKANIEIVTYKDVRSELARLSKHPTRGGIFGILSMGFLISVIISLIGYLLYWFFNLSSRVVQFGILRAMGLSRRQLTGMLLLEQIFTAGLSIGIGILLGKLASRLFLPFLQSAENAKMQVPPFRIIFDAKDTMQLYAVVAVMILTGATLLFMQIRRLRVHQAVKMGEER
ncbi:MAG: ABC transporter permease [Paenibacillus dendritiformis]|uniref:ABC transporter permease n=1 Tax=Paenibacillus dendritiformis TaxID=130049 RepID=UPI00143CEDF7|nr:FtsX-like permease family protein [Paenibacillus dendritiformis]MDU5143182.1 ABC transporter permease [Paenibacillus dendritiformis]NKI20722.1 FtsX-like permease family protein [Paenibacillus dendritiformis]NRF96800.1 FtsX-like permease family protein [Paenibacillus dendritiformis]